MSTSQPKRRRRRGVILTSEGLAKFQAAKSTAEFADNGGNRYTLEALSERTGLAVDTLMKVLACESGVDKQTLKFCFQAFHLSLDAGDFFYPDTGPPDWPIAPAPAPAPEPGQTPDLNPVFELPEGQVPLESAFYIDRPPIETDSYQAVLQPGALIRIKGARRMGKSSLMVRILHQAAQSNCQTVSLSFQLADRAVFQDLNRLLQWFCASVGLGIGLPNRLTDYWDELFGSQMSCKMYFEQYLLAKTSQPLVLGLDDVDRLFQFPELAGDFFGLLRTWHEEGKNRDIWKKLRLVVVHSTDVYIPLDANRSPFNVGLPIELSPFTVEQIQELAERYGVTWNRAEAASLGEWVGGQPYLVRKGLYHVWHHDTTLADLIQPASLRMGIYGEHLQRQLLHLQRQPELAAVFRQILESPTPPKLDLMKLAQLQSMGLIDLQGDRPVLSCALYQTYFSATQLELEA